MKVRENEGGRPVDRLYNTRGWSATSGQKATTASQNVHAKRQQRRDPRRASGVAVRSLGLVPIVRYLDL